MSTRRRASWESRLLNSRLRSQTFQFAISRMLLARARRGMVGHQQFDQRASNSHHSIGIGLDRHALLGLTNAGSCVNPLAHIHNAHAAYSHRILILLVAESRNRNAVNAGSVENSCALGNRHSYAVDCQLYLFHSVGLPASS